MVKPRQTGSRPPHRMRGPDLCAQQGAATAVGTQWGEALRLSAGRGDPGVVDLLEFAGGQQVALR